MVIFIEDPTWESKLREGLKPTIGHVTEDIGKDVRENLAPHTKTGELLGSVDVNPATGTVSIGTDHWQFIEYGTAPHEIKAKPGHFLKIGNTFRREVHHPGTREYAPMRRALMVERPLR